MDELFEIRGREVFYKGQVADTLQDHFDKCGPCARVNQKFPGYVVPHGQIMRFNDSHD